MARTKAMYGMRTGDPFPYKRLPSTISRAETGPQEIAVPGSRRLYRHAATYDPTQPIKQIPQTYLRPSAPTGKPSATDTNRKQKAAWHKRVYEAVEAEEPKVKAKAEKRAKRTKVAKAVTDMYFGPLVDGQEPEAYDSTMAGAVGYLQYGRDYDTHRHNSVLVAVHGKHTADAEALNAANDAHDAGTQTDMRQFADPQVSYRAPPTLRRARSAQTWVRA